MAACWAPLPVERTAEADRAVGFGEEGADSQICVNARRGGRSRHGGRAAGSHSCSGSACVFCVAVICEAAAGCAHEDDQCSALPCAAEMLHTGVFLVCEMAEGGA